MRIAAIIPNRGEERKIFYTRQVERASQMGYDKVYLVNYPPIDDKFDLFQRIAVGVSKATADGYDYVSIIESDDYYSLDYLTHIKPLLESAEIVGINYTTYYHLFTTGYKTMTHPGRSSMFCTSFRTDLFSKLPSQGAPYHDLSIWKFVQDRAIAFRLTDKELAIGIKHGNVFGKVGGNGHLMRYDFFDHNLNKLSRMVDKESIKFYIELKSSYQREWEQTKYKKL